jgi:hypothetical protein
MLSWIIQISLISIIFIFLVHHILMFFKTTLTVPKIKDLVNSPNQKYQNIYDTISHNSNNSSSGYTDIDLLPSDTTGFTKINSMKDELKTFLKKQLNGRTENVMGIDLTPDNISTF